MPEVEDLRFKVIKNMLNEFPELREKVKKWLLEKQNFKSTNIQ